MTYFTFESDREGWDPSDAWDGAAGAAPGCLHVADPGGAPAFTVSDLALSVSVGDPCSCNVRVTANGTATGGTLAIRMHVSGDGDDYFTTTITVPDDPADYDSGWRTISGLLSFTGTVDSVTITFDYDLALISYPFESFLDNVYVAESPPVPGGLLHSAGGIPGAVLVA